MYTKVVTHPGKAHRSDVLALALALAKSPQSMVERRLPSPRDLASAETLVIDVGEQYNPDRLNFDSHALKDDKVPVCSLSLYLKWAGKYELAKIVWPWLELTEKVDVFGIGALRESMQLDAHTISAFASPIEKVLLRQVSTTHTLYEDSAIHRSLVAIGRDLWAELGTYTTRFDLLSRKARVSVTRHGLSVLVVTGIKKKSDPKFGTEAYCKVHHLNVDAIVCLDKRYTGWAIFPRSSRINAEALAKETKMSASRYTLTTSHPLPLDELLAILDRNLNN